MATVRCVVVLITWFVAVSVGDEQLSGCNTNGCIQTGVHKRSLPGGFTEVGHPSAKTVLRVTTITEVPFTTFDHKSQRIVGLIPDMLHELGYLANMRFRLHLVADGRYGGLDRQGNWTGMIGELVRKEETDNKYLADIAAAGLTITHARSRVVHFISPFKHTGLVMVTKKFSKEEFLPVNFRVTDPLAPEVWLICTLSVFVVGLLLFAHNKVNPYEWSGRFGLGRASELHADTFNLPGSMWFAFTTLQWQGYERAPRSLGARVLSVFWFVFVSITLLTYSASLVNWLFWASTVHGKDFSTHPIQDLEHLVTSKQYSYGCVKGGATFSYLTMGSHDMQARIHQYLMSEEGQKNLFSNVQEGFDNVVSKPNYVFIVEEMTALHRLNQRPCNLAISGKVFAQRSYGLAVRKNIDMDILQRLNTATLQLQELGTMDRLEKEWIEDKGQCWNVTRMERLVTQQTLLSLNKPKQIGMREYWGPVVLLVVGMLLSLLTGLGETLYFKFRGRYQPTNRPGTSQLKLDDDGMM